MVTMIMLHNDNAIPTNGDYAHKLDIKEKGVDGKMTVRKWTWSRF